VAVAVAVATILVAVELAVVGFDVGLFELVEEGDAGARLGVAVTALVSVTTRVGVTVAIVVRVGVIVGRSKMEVEVSVAATTRTCSVGGGKGFRA
jgi:hypothetical protein